MMTCNEVPVAVATWLSKGERFGFDLYESEESYCLFYSYL